MDVAGLCACGVCILTCLCGGGGGVASLCACGVCILTCLCGSGGDVSSSSSSNSNSSNSSNSSSDPDAMNSEPAKASLSTIILQGAATLEKIYPKSSGRFGEGRTTPIKSRRQRVRSETFVVKQLIQSNPDNPASSSTVIQNHASSQGYSGITTYLASGGGNEGPRKNQPRQTSTVNYKEDSIYVGMQGISDETIRHVIYSFYVTFGSDHPDDWFGHNGTIDQIMTALKPHFKERINSRRVLRTLRSIVEAWDSGRTWSAVTNCENKGAQPQSVTSHMINVCRGVPEEWRSEDLKRKIKEDEEKKAMKDANERMKEERKAAAAKKKEDALEKKRRRDGEKEGSESAEPKGKKAKTKKPSGNTEGTGAEVAMETV